MTGFFRLNRTVLPWMLAAFLGGALVMYSAVVFWPKTTSALGFTDPWTQDLEAVWRPMLDRETPLLVTFETRFFVKIGTLVIRDSKINDFGHLESSEQLMQIKKLFHTPQLYESKNFTDFGAAQGLFLLSRLLGTRTANLNLKRSDEVTGEDLRNSNRIFIGKLVADPEIRKVLAQGEIIDEGGRIRIVHPRPGEQSEYSDQKDTASPETWGEKYAVISMFPSPEGGKRLLSLATAGSEHPWAVAYYLTNPVSAKQLVEHLRLPSGRLPEYYQVLVKIHFQRQAPIQVDYVTHRILNPSRAGQ